MEGLERGPRVAHWAACILLSLLSSASSYNLDTLNPLVLGQGLSGDFGYAVTFHSPTADRSSVFAIIGAPRSTQQNRFAGQNVTGAVFQCNLTFGNTSCSQLDVDIGPNVEVKQIMRNKDLEYREEKSYMRLGHSVQSAGAGQPLVACAPHFHDVFKVFASDLNKPVGVTHLWDPVGRCYSLPSNLAASQFPLGTDSHIQPCYSAAREKTKEGGLFDGFYSCRTGHSLDFAETSPGRWSPLMGAPTAGITDGRAFLYREARRRFVATPMDVNGTHKNGLTGFSVSAGKYSGSQEEVAIAAPKTNNFRGAVIVTPANGPRSMLINYDFFTLGSWQASLDDPSLTVAELTSQQFGEFFGFSMASADVDGDGETDLLVGAPNFYLEGGVTNGRVYIYTKSLSKAMKAGGSRDVKPDDHITGESGSQLGKAIATLGDIDLDGYDDVAIAAPFANGMAGAVYIHYGSAKGLLTERSQTITASQLGMQNVQGFGLSVAKGFDLDKNDYNDILLGAPLSNRVVAIRSRPVVDIVVFFSTSRAGTRRVIDFTTDISNSDCSFFPEAGLTCFKIFVCAESTSESPSVISYNVVVDRNLQLHPVTGASIRPFNNNITIQSARTPLCQKEIIFVRVNVRTPCRPAKLMVDWTLVDLDSTPERLSPIARMTNVKNPIEAEVNMLGSCSACVPDLGINGATFLTSDGSMDTIIAGLTESATLGFTIGNSGNLLSCNAEAFVTLPLGVTFAKELLPGNASCFLDLSHDVPNTVRCSLPPATLIKSTHDFTLRLNLLKIAEMPTNPTIVIRAASNNTEMNLQNNERTERLSVRTQALLQVNAFARHETVEIETTAVDHSTTLRDVGPEIQHVYQLFNNGPSSVPPSQVAIAWPLRTKSNVDLLYLTAVESERKGAVRCNHSSLLDTEQLRVMNTSKSGNGVTPVLGAQSSAAPVCDSSLCWVTIECSLPSMASKAATSVSLTWRAKSKAISDAGLLPYNVTTWVELVGFEQRVAFEWINNLDNVTAEATTYLTGYVAKKSRSLQLWIIIVPIVVGLLLIILLILLLWKCGFFKRNKDFKRISQRESGHNRRVTTSEV